METNTWRKEGQWKWKRVVILIRKGIITKELEIKQDPIVELKAIEVEINNNHIIHATACIGVVKKITKHVCKRNCP